jgi:hypothetical protein
MFFFMLESTFVTNVLMLLCHVQCVLNMLLSKHKWVCLLLRAKINRCKEMVVLSLSI